MPPGSTQCQSLVISRSHVPLLSWDAPVRSSYFPPWEYSVILSSGSADNSNKKLNSHFSESQCDCPRPQLPHRCPDGGGAPADVAVTFDICSSCLARSVGVYTQHRRANSDHLSRWSDCCVHRVLPTSCTRELWVARKFITISLFSFCFVSPNVSVLRQRNCNSLTLCACSEPYFYLLQRL